MTNHTGATRLVGVLLGGVIALVGMTVAAGPVAAVETAASDTNGTAPVKEDHITLGTKVSFRNDTGHPIFIRAWVANAFWTPAIANVAQGDWYTQADNSKMVDDVEFRIFKSYQDAKDNKNYIEVDAENPSWGHPYMVVNWHEHKFNVNETYEYRVKDDKAIFWSKRYADSEKYKEFHLHMKTIW